MAGCLETGENLTVPVPVPVPEKGAKRSVSFVCHSPYLSSFLTPPIVYSKTCTAWVEVQAKLLTAIIASVMPADLLALRDPLFGDLLLDIPTVLAHVAKEHGRVTAERGHRSAEGHAV